MSLVGRQQTSTPLGHVSIRELLLPALLPDSAPIPVWIAVFVIAGVLMGMTVGAVTGYLLIRLQPVTPK